MFNGKVVIITGGSSGLGAELARRLVPLGAKLALIARDSAKLEAVRKELMAGRSPAPTIGIFSCDVSDPAAVEKTFQAIAAELGPPEVLIVSAGILRESYFEEQTLATFREVMDINYFGTLHCIKAVLPYFKNQGGGRIVNICSMAGFIGTFGYAAYCSSKHAVVGLTEALRQELKPQNIQFHLVCPGEFESPMVDELNKNRTEENRFLVQTVPVLGVKPVADAVMAGLARGQYLIIPGVVARWIQRLNRWWPALSRKIADARVKKVYRGPKMV